ncbi:hypothetical protein [Pseudorhodoferax sp. Leaf267]|uniref:hypothetical protein n=1 Tax=Pseudorhodoferax sp. Leaf267 TaxID=1736316 RepID=UPI0006FB64E8|nr:hypothetical protein [Pseudorhodoferax sp. Leaf267]KQP21990.1 hypothetical protein ASF43_24370 [Pseudorhodoferax sp. Leaf267]
MAQRDHRNQQSDYRDHDGRQQDQYADSNRQYGGQYGSGRDERQYGGRDASSYRGDRDDLSRNDPTQASYGRFGAPDVHNQPSGGYGGASSYGHQDRQRYDPYQGRQGNQGYGGYGTQDFDQGYRSQDQRRGYNPYDQGQPQAGYWGQEDQRDRGRFQGGSGGYQSNTGAYAGAQNYGGSSDQLGYGSNQGGGRHQGHWDPDYQQWRDEQVRNLDNDYHSWRGERYKKFSDEFSEWRKNRPAGDPQRSESAGADTGKRTGGGAASGGGTSGTK